VVEIVNDILADGIEACYIMGENPAMSDPDTAHVRQALAKLNHLVVQEIFLTETAYFADVILPASAFAEKTGSFTNTNRQVQMARPAVKITSDAWQDWEIIVELANRMGLNWQYSNVGDVFEEMRSVMPSISGISWQRLEQEHAVTYPCHDENDLGEAVIFGDGFPTASGKVKLVPTNIVPPDELPDADYPFVLTTGRLLEHWHTGAMTRRAEVLDGIEPEAVVHIHPKTLEKLNVNAGEKVKVSTRRGALELKTRADRDIADDMIFIPFCFAESPANMLTNPALDPFGKIPEFKFCAADVRPTN